MYKRQDVGSGVITSDQTEDLDWINNLSLIHILITLLGNCMNMLGLSTYMQTVMRGAVLVVAIWLDNRKGQ